MAKIDRSNDPVNAALPMTKQFWKTIVAGLLNGSNYFVKSNPGMAKTGQSADELRALVAAQGGLFYGPGHNDTLMIDRPYDRTTRSRADRTTFKLAGDPRMPVVV